MLDAFDETEAERIITLPKRILGQIQWRQKDDGNWYMEMPIEAEEQLPLQLYGRFNPRTRNFVFILFYKQINLCRLDVGKSHHNPDCANVGTVHKHKWADRFQDKWAYGPSEIGLTDSMHQVFIKFMLECNVTVEAKFIAPPQGVQGRLI
jgi:hypothetical protein